MGGGGIFLLASTALCDILLLGVPSNKVCICDMCNLKFFHTAPVAHVANLTAQMSLFAVGALRTSSGEGGRSF